MNYHYKGVFTFKNDADGAEPAGFDLCYTDGVTYYNQVIANWQGHAKVLDMYDNNAGAYPGVRDNLAEHHLTGAIEFYWGTSDSTKESYLQTYNTDISYISILMRIYGGYFQAYNATTPTNTAVCANDTCYHIRIIWTATTWRVYIDGAYYGEYSFYGMVGDGMNMVQWSGTATGTGVHTYVDAIDYSWETGYYAYRTLDYENDPGIYFDDVLDTNQSFYHYTQGVNELPDAIVISIADPLMTLYAATYDASYLGKDIKILSDTPKLVWQGRVNALPRWQNGYVIITGEGPSEQYTDRKVTALSKYLVALTAGGLTTVQDLYTGDTNQRFTGYCTGLSSTVLTDADKAFTVDAWIGWMCVIDTLAQIPAAERYLSLDWQAGDQNLHAGGSIADINVQAGSSDADYMTVAGEWRNSADDVYVGTNVGPTDCLRGYFRFPLNLPKGSTVTVGNFHFYARTEVGDAEYWITLIDSDNCAAFPNGAGAEGYTVTTTKVSWDPTGMPGANQSVDIITLIQAFIDRAGYYPGQYMGLRIALKNEAESNHQVQVKTFEEGTKAHLSEIAYTPPALDKIQFKITGSGATSLTLDTAAPSSFTINGLILGNAYMIVPQTTSLAGIMVTTWDYWKTISTVFKEDSQLAIVKRFAQGATAKDVISACRSLDGFLQRLRITNEQLLQYYMFKPVTYSNLGTLPLDVRKDRGCAFEVPLKGLVNLITAIDRYGVTITRAWNYLTHSPQNDSITWDPPTTDNLNQIEMTLPCPEYADGTILKNMMDVILKSQAEPQLSENINVELLGDVPIFATHYRTVEPGLKVNVIWKTVTYSAYMITRKEYDSQTKQCRLKLVLYRA